MLGCVETKKGGVPFHSGCDIIMIVLDEVLDIVLGIIDSIKLSLSSNKTMSSCNINVKEASYTDMVPV